MKFNLNSIKKRRRKPASTTRSTKPSSSSSSMVGQPGPNARSSPTCPARSSASIRPIISTKSTTERWIILIARTRSSRSFSKSRQSRSRDSTSRSLVNRKRAGRTTFKILEVSLSTSEALRSLNFLQASSLCKRRATTYNRNSTPRSQQTDPTSTRATISEALTLLQSC